MTINALLAKGYVFSGLDEKGNKKQQVCNGINAPKILIFLGNVTATVSTILRREESREHFYRPRKNS